MEFYRRIKIPDEVVERPEGGLEGGYEATSWNPSTSRRGWRSSLYPSPIRKRGPLAPRGVGALCT
jgi:hypothetical protein